MNARILASLCAVVPQLAFGACDKAAEGSAAYQKAVARVQALPQYKEWLKHVEAKPGAKAVLLPAVDKQSLIAGTCYWSVTVYSEEGTHLSRWNTFFVGANGNRVLVEDPNGEPVPLKKLRSNPAAQSDAFRSALYAPPHSAPGRERYAAKGDAQRFIASTDTLST